MDVKPKYTYEQLIEKIVRAKVKLEGTRRRHHDRCMVELDPEYYGPCTCGVDSGNAGYYAALKELEL